MLGFVETAINSNSCSATVHSLGRNRLPHFLHLIFGLFLMIGFMFFPNLVSRVYLRLDGWTRCMSVRPSTAPLRLGSPCVVAVCEEPPPFGFMNAMTCAVPDGVQFAVMNPAPDSFS